MRPLMYSVNDAETKDIGWRRWGEEIVYYRNNLPYGKTRLSFFEIILFFL